MKIRFLVLSRLFVHNRVSSAFVARAVRSRLLVPMKLLSFPRGLKAEQSFECASLIMYPKSILSWAFPTPNQSESQSMWSKIVVWTPETEAGGSKEVR